MHLWKDGSDGEMIIDGSMVESESWKAASHEDQRRQASPGDRRKSENLDILLKNEVNGTLCELGIGTTKQRF